MKLFAIYIGGRHKSANIELHDMRFVLAESIEDTYAQLRKEWWGIPESLHLDCWCELNQADGYKITLQTKPSKGNLKLYYVNLGGYDKNEFSELHRNTFIVAESETQAKFEALDKVRHWTQTHKDDIFEAEDSFCINKEAELLSYYIHLKKIADETPAPFTCQYKKIGK